MNEDFSDVILVTEDKKQMRVQHHANQCFPSMFSRMLHKIKKRFLKVAGVFHSFYHCQQKPLLYLVKLSLKAKSFDGTLVEGKQ